MTYGDSWVSLCNRALARIGTGTIQSLTAENVNRENAKLCVLYLPEVVGSLMASFPWKFATRTAELARLDDAPVYPLPEGIARIIEVSAPGDYKITSRGIETSTGPVVLTYVELPQDPSLIPPHVGKAISALLAFEVSASLVSNDSVIARLRLEAQAAVERAKIDDQAGAPDPAPAGWYEEAR